MGRYGEPPEDPLLLFSVLYAAAIPSYIAFNGDLALELAAQFLALAEKQKAIVPRMVGHRFMGAALTTTGDIVEGRAHFDRAIALYDPAEHRPLATRRTQSALGSMNAANADFVLSLGDGFVGAWLPRSRARGR